MFLISTGVAPVVEYQSSDKSEAVLFHDWDNVCE